MDVDILRLAELNIKVEEATIEFEDNDEKDLTETSYGSESYNCTINDELSFIKQESEDYEELNNHFITLETSAGAEDNSKRFQCNECGKPFNRKDHLQNHKRTHSGERLLKCEFCGKCFTKPYNFTRHKQYIHENIMTFFKCEDCGRTFSRKDHLKSHQLTHKNQIETKNEIAPFLETYTCEKCGRAYCRLDNYKKHMQKHFEEQEETLSTSDPDTKPVFDGVDFHFMSANQVAVTGNSSVRPHGCKYCGRLFLRKDHLRNHERIHTGERPFQCSECGKRFAKRFVMTRHLQNVHRINVKFHECTHCGRKFARSDHLKTHMKIHILASVKGQQKIRTYNCDMCDSSFSRHDNLKTHMKIHLFAAIQKRQENKRLEDKRLSELKNDGE